MRKTELRQQDIFEDRFLKRRQTDVVTKDFLERNYNG